ncbi:Arm DNA-binding domain-containing protein [Sphingomonas turrisvirgatae]|nr:Arm DNA-binding domain-containing protein [Sphingomonas turrisvirgatae]
MILLLTPSGSRLWRFKYRFNGKEKKLAFDSYLEIPIKGSATA